MVQPLLSTRVEEANDLSRARVRSGDPVALVIVSAWALIIILL